MKINTKQIVLIALFVALGLILPQAFHLAGPNLARMFSPIHIPALIAGALMGMFPGLLVGVLTVLASSLFTNMPPFPYAIVMMVEVGSYGLFAGLFAKFVSRDLFGTILSTAFAMIVGRVIYGFAQYIFLAANQPEKSYTVAAWVSSMFVKGLPAIILHLVLVPIIIVFLRKNIRDFN